MATRASALLSVCCHFRGEVDGSYDDCLQVENWARTLCAVLVLGIGRGDHYDSATGSQNMGSIKPEDRNTPAGRFNVSLQRDVKGKEVLLIDYEAAIALHPVVKGTPAERRAERLNSPTAEDNRISYGCINVPVQFYQEIVSPAFTKTNGVVYILPEKSSAPKFFGFPADANSP